MVLLSDNFMKALINIFYDVDGINFYFDEDTKTDKIDTKILGRIIKDAHKHQKGILGFLNNHTKENWILFLADDLEKDENPTIVSNVGDLDAWKRGEDPNLYWMGDL